MLKKNNEAGDAPKAYLNYLVFDRNYKVLDGGFVRVTEAAKENGSDGAHEELSKEIEIKEAGYVYLYLSNDNVALGGSAVEVYFDDFKVEHVKSPVVQVEDYYPFGLSFNSYRRENSLENRIKFQGQEHIGDLDLGWDSFKWRNHDPAIGRFFNVDPLSEKYYYNSVYAFSENKVIAHVELEGLESSYGPLNQEIKKVEGAWNNFVNKIEQVVDKVVETLTVPKDPEFKKVDEVQSDPTGTGDLDWGSTNEADFNPKGKPHIENNDAKVVNVTEGGQKESSAGESDVPKTTKEVFTVKTKMDTVWSEVTREDNLQKDSTFWKQDYKTGDGQSGTKIIKKQQGAWNWQTQPH